MNNEDWDQLGQIAFANEFGFREKCKIKKLKGGKRIRGEAKPKKEKNIINIGGGGNAAKKEKKDKNEYKKKKGKKGK